MVIAQSVERVCSVRQALEALRSLWRQPRVIQACTLRFRRASSIACASSEDAPKARRALARRSSASMLLLGLPCQPACRQPERRHAARLEMCRQDSGPAGWQRRMHLREQRGTVELLRSAIALSCDDLLQQRLGRLKSARGSELPTESREGACGQAFSGLAPAALAHRRALLGRSGRCTPQRAARSIARRVGGVLAGHGQPPVTQLRQHGQQKGLARAA